MNARAARRLPTDMAIKKIGRYEICEQLGKGGMGVVFKALDPELDRFVAIKLISPDIDVSREVLARFLREARSAAKFSHANIVSIHDVGQREGHPYIVMEYVEGQDLREIIEKQAFVPFEEKTEIVAQICRGLAYAHRFGVVHRDINPRNIRISKTGEVKILDFGIARIEESDMTRTNQQVGTPAYMSPEQVDRRVEVDGRSDLFSVGVILYQLITGRKPFDADTISGLYFQIISQPVDLSAAMPACAPQLAAITEKALAKDPDERFADGDQMADACAEFKARLPSETTSLVGKLEHLIAEFEERLDAAARLPVIADFYDPSLFRVDLPSQHADDYGILLRTFAQLKDSLDLEAERRQQVAILARLEKQAQQQWKAAKAAECLRNTEKMLEIHPAHPNALDLRRKCREEARLQEERGQRVESGLVLARQTLADGDDLKCLRMATALLELAPEHPGVKSLHEEARTAYQARFQDLLDKAAECEQNHDYEAGLEMVRIGLESDPEHPQLVSLQARLEKGLAQQRRQAAQSMEEARRLENEGKYQQALGILDTVPALGPDNTEMAALRQRLEEAERRRNLDKLLQQARSKIKSGDRTAGRELVQQGLKLDPENQEFKALLGQLEANLERTPVPASAEANLAELLETANQELKEGRLEEASRNTEFVLTLDPSNRQALEIRQRIASRLSAATKATDPQSRTLPEKTVRIQEATPKTAATPYGLRIPRQWLPLTAASLLVLLLAVAAAWVWLPGGAPAIDAPKGALIIRPAPWARVVSVVSTGDNAEMLDPGRETYTPCRIALPPGEYKVRLSHSDYEDVEFVAVISLDAPYEHSEALPGFELEDEVKKELLRIQLENGP